MKERWKVVFLVTCNIIIIIFPALSVCLPVFSVSTYVAYQISLIITVIICTPVKYSSVEFTLFSHLLLFSTDICVPQDHDVQPSL